MNINESKFQYHLFDWMIKLIKRVKASLENILKIITKTRTGENGHHFEFISKLVKIIEVETKRNL